MIASKCTLAARIDSGHESPSGAMGQTMREEIEKKLEKLQVCFLSARARVCV